MPYLIDGNNLLGSWGGPAVPGDGRAEVVRRVAAFCRAKGARAVLVFDGAPFRPDLGGQELGAVSLRFPSAGRDADSLIRELVDARRAPGRARRRHLRQAPLLLRPHARRAGPPGARVERPRARREAEGGPRRRAGREARARDRRRGLAEALLARVSAS